MTRLTHEEATWHQTATENLTAVFAALAKARQHLAAVRAMQQGKAA